MAGALHIPQNFLRNEIEEARMTELLWEHGRLRYLLWPSQRPAYDFIHAWKKGHPNSALPIVLNCHRGYGKTMVSLVIPIERALGRPGQVIRYGTGTIADTKDIVEPNLQKLLEYCPRHLQPKRCEGGQEYWFRNPRWPRGSRPSVIHIIGCKERANRHRGKRSNLIVLDEGRNIENFQYVATTVFGPHFAKQDDPLYLMPSTPPDSPDHAWSRVYCFEAEQEGRYIEIPVTSNADWTPEDDQRMLELFRDKTSAEWRREMLCERIPDPERLIVREFDEKRHVVESYPRPEHFIPLNGADGGFVDFFASLYGYIDWKAARLVIEDSVVLKGKNTGVLAEAIKAKEEELFRVKHDNGTTEWAGGDHHPRRHADMTPREIADLNEIYKLSFSPAETHDPDSQINHLRDHFHKNKVVIIGGGGKNRELIAQLKNGTRDDKGKIPRSEVHGHYDALMALVYLNRMAPWNRNPYPDKVDFDESRQAPGRIARARLKKQAPRSAPAVGAKRSFLQQTLRPRKFR